VSEHSRTGKCSACQANDRYWDHRPLKAVTERLDAVRKFAERMEARVDRPNGKRYAKPLRTFKRYVAVAQAY